MTKTEAAESRRRWEVSIEGFRASIPVGKIDSAIFPSEVGGAVKAAQWISGCQYVEANGAEE